MLPVKKHDPPQTSHTPHLLPTPPLKAEKKKKTREPLFPASCFSFIHTRSNGCVLFCWSILLVWLSKIVSQSGINYQIFSSIESINLIYIPSLRRSLAVSRTFMWRWGASSAVVETFTRSRLGRLITSLAASLARKSQLKALRRWERLFFF